MAVSVSGNLSVVVEDVVGNKLADIQGLLKNLEKGETKALGVSQLMLGLLIMINSIPLLSTDFTEIVAFGVPLWSGLVFVIAGCLSIMMEKYTNRKYLHACVAMSTAAMLTSVTALIIYVTDISKHLAVDCDPHGNCSNKHYTMMLSTGVKTSLALYTLIHIIISGIVTHTLYKARKHLDIYERISR